MDYKKQADEFLQSCGISMIVEKAVPQSSPLWAQDGEHGTQWSIELLKGSKRVQFFFWSSLADKKHYENPNRKDWYKKDPSPSAYDVLAGLYMKGFDTFKEFCDCFGFDEDSMKAYKTYEQVLQLNTKLESIFTQEELEKLQEIQ